MKDKIQTIVSNAVRILDLCQEIGSGEYSEKGIRKRVSGISYNAKDILELLEALKEDVHA